MAIESFSKEALTIINAIMITIMGLIAFIFRRSVKDIEQNKKDIAQFNDRKVEETEFNHTIDRLEKTMSDGFTRMEWSHGKMSDNIREDLKEIHNRIDDVIKSKD